MSRIERYIFKLAALGFLVALLGLTGVVWVTQALRQLDLLTSKGQNLWIFLTLTGLTIPSLIGIIAPVALLAGVIYALNKLNSDSELVVMSAAGVSPLQMARPLLTLFTLAFALSSFLYLYAMPWSFDAIKILTSHVRADFISNFARPGAFSELEAGFVFHYRERSADGALHGVFMQDRRDPAHITTYIAEVGNVVERAGANVMVLGNGTYQRPQSAGDSAIITFQDYSIDLNQFIKTGEVAKKARERSTWELLSPGENSEPRYGRNSAELIDRLTSPLYAFVAGLIAFAALGEARTTRQSRASAILTAILAFTALRMLSFAAISMAAKGWEGEALAWGAPLIACAISLDMCLNGPGKKGLSAFRTRRLRAA